MSPVHNLGLQVSVETSSGKSAYLDSPLKKRLRFKTENWKCCILRNQGRASTPRRRGWWDGTARGRSSPSWWRSSKSARCTFAPPAPPAGNAGSRTATDPRSHRMGPEAWARQVSVMTTTQSPNQGMQALTQNPGVIGWCAVSFWSVPFHDPLVIQARSLLTLKPKDNVQKISSRCSFFYGFGIKNYFFEQDIWCFNGNIC